MAVDDAFRLRHWRAEAEHRVVFNMVFLEDQYCLMTRRNDLSTEWRSAVLLRSCAKIYHTARSCVARWLPRKLVT